MVRFLVFSDLHLDHRVEDDGPDHRARRRADRRACLERILALADTHEVDAILSAGDLYAHRGLQPGTNSFLVDRLGQAGRPVFLAPGDEDPHTPDSLYATTSWPANVHVFAHDLLVPVELADGFRLWGAAHLRHDGTTGFLDGFRIADDAVNLALFHGSEVGAPSDDTDRVVAPFRAEQVEQAGLTHAFVGNGRAAVDAPWHTIPGPSAAVIVDVASDGALRRQRFDVAGPPVHEVTVDLTDAASTDEVLERMLASVEDLQGVVHVSLHGQPAADAVVVDDELASWSTERLEIVVRPRPAAPPLGRDVEPPAPVDLPVPPVSVAAPVPPARPSAEVVLEVTAAHDAWQEALAGLRRHARDEPAPVEHPDLGGMGVDTLEVHLETLRTHPSARQPDPQSEAPRREAPPGRRPSRRRAIARAVAALVTVGAAIGLLLVGETVVERGVAAVAMLIVAAMAVTARRGVGEDPDLAASEARVRATLRIGMELSSEDAPARHTATAALRQAGLPTDADELAALLEAVRDAEARQATRTAWEQRRAGLASELVEATRRLRAALRRGGLADTLDVEAAWARFQAEAGREPARSLRSAPTASGSPAVVG